MASVNVDTHVTATDQALCRLYAVRPVWDGVQSAAEAVELPAMTLLHAGPPFADPTRPSAPVLASAVLCCLYEGWAESEAKAEALIASGQVRLMPAQHYRVVTPLGAVISPSTQLVRVIDAAHPGHPACWSLLSSGAGPQIRFGTRSPEVLPRLAWRDGPLAEALRLALNHSPVALIPLAIIGLAGGDDLHSRTTVATRALLSELSRTLDDPAVVAMLEATPLFFLTLWMAACFLMLDATRDQEASLVLALAGNGTDAGVRLSNDPDHWITTAAHVPDGPRLTASVAEACPMLGDSGVIDAAGFGAQAWFHCTEVASGMRGWLPGVPAARPRWLVGEHPLFEPFRLGSAIDARQVTADRQTPRVAIAMLDAQGREGLLGRGICQTDPALFGVDAATPGMAINEPSTLATLHRLFERYELALTSNDVAELDTLFWDSPHTVRYGAGEHLYGYEAIQAFRRARPGAGLERALEQRSITTFGNRFAVTHMVFSRVGEPRLGRQTQSWACIDGHWRIVAAHVSWMDL